MSSLHVWWVAFWSSVAVAGLVGTVVTSNSMRFQRRVNREVREMFTPAADAEPVDPTVLARLPDPVRRYLIKATGDPRRPVRSVRLRQHGTFRPDLNGGWYPITGVQYINADPPGFIWWGRVTLAPGLWVEARDRSVDGTGQMLVVMESSFTLNDARGPELDQGALLRLLGELVWLPTVFLDGRYIRWSPIDNRHAKAALSVNGREVDAVFEFGDDDLPVTFKAERFRDIGNGKSVLTPFLGECREYRRVDGLLVPHELIGSWIIDSTPMPYARFGVVALEFNSPAPFD